MPEEIKLIKERFRIDSLIAYGGMARVYKGTDLTLARTVAVKVLSEDLAKDPNFLLRFRREAQAAASLTHPNIVGVYDTGAEAGIHYIVMEYVEGSTLQEILADEGPLSPERAAAIGADVARALAEAHKKGIVHRDVKPGNIMVAKNGFVKVMDFGIAKAATSGALTQVGSVLGTVAYLSPEQAREEEVDARSDIYSLGSMVYQMLTGRAPFTAETLMEMVNKLNNQAPTPPTRLNPIIPLGLEAVVMKSLAKDPTHRYQDGNEFAKHLLLSLNGDPSATAAFVASPTAAGEEDADRTRVAAAPVVAVGAGIADPRTAVMPAARRSASRAAPVDPFPMRQAVLGGLVVLILLLIGAYVFSNMGDGGTTTLIEPTPSPTLVTTTLPASGAGGTRVTRPPATTTVPVQEETVPQTQPETSPQTQPEPPPETTPTTAPPNPGQSPPPLAGAVGQDGRDGNDAQIAQG